MTGATILSEIAVSVASLQRLPRVSSCLFPGSYGVRLHRPGRQGSPPSHVHSAGRGYGVRWPVNPLAVIGSSYCAEARSQGDTGVAFTARSLAARRWPTRGPSGRQAVPYARAPSSHVRIPARSGSRWMVPSSSTRPIPPPMSCTAAISSRLRFHRTPQRVSPSSGLSRSLQRHRSPTDTPRSPGAQTGALIR